MLAKISPSSPSPLPTPAPPSFWATFNPSPDPPTSNQFFLTSNGDPVSNLNLVSNLILVDDDTPITIRLTGGATFPSEGVNFPPIVWSLKPDSILSGPTVTDDGSTLSFTVPAPTNVFSPWVFRLIVDVNGINGVRSQNIYLTKTLSGNTLYLEYNSDNGSFSLTDNLGSSQDGAVLGEDLVLVNTQLTGDVTLSGVNWINGIVSDPPNFALEPIIWSSGSQPDWIPFGPTGGGTPTISFNIDQASGMGRGIGLQFAIMVDDQTVLSPDPILINSTIGDG